MEHPRRSLKHLRAVQWLVTEEPPSDETEDLSASHCSISHCPMEMMHYWSDPDLY